MPYIPRHKIESLNMLYIWIGRRKSSLLIDNIYPCVPFVENCLQLR